MIENWNLSIEKVKHNGVLLLYIKKKKIYNILSNEALSWGTTIYALKSKNYTCNRVVHI